MKDKAILQEDFTKAKVDIEGMLKEINYLKEDRENQINRRDKIIDSLKL
jgi:hypothetical protein